MNILIVEDEQMIAERLLRMISAYFTKGDVTINHCDSLGEGLEYIEKNTIDLLFLDLNLNGENGFEVLQNVVSRSFQTIIVSAYKAKAIEAFEYGVLDFVPKPFNEKRLHQALDRIESRPSKDTSLGIIKYLSIIKRGNHHLLPLDNINYIQGARVYTEIHMNDGSEEIHNKSLDSLIQLLPSSYERIHKSYIVNMEHVKEFKAASGGKYSVVLKTEVELPVGRSRYKDLKEKYFI